VSIKYELKLPDGGDAGTFETNLSDWKVGDEFIGDGNKTYRITAMIPLGRIEEFVDGRFMRCGRSSGRSRQPHGTGLALLA
jgi:hypothetical protein